MEPFSTSIYKVLICILATTTKIFAEGGSSRARAQRFSATDTLSYSPRRGIEHAWSQRRDMGATLQRHSFSGLIDSAVNKWLWLTDHQPPSIIHSVLELVLHAESAGALKEWS